MRKDSARLQDIIAPVVTALGYELVGVVHVPQGRHSLLRVYIDCVGDDATGITLEDCERVSHQVSGVLDVEDPIKGQYALEVSSPGLERPLFSKEQFARFAGQRAKVRLHTPLNGRRNFTGMLAGVRDEQVVIVEDGVEFALPVGSIDKAQLAPDYSGK
ncbi:MAG: ribosome maturation factor RimP [Gammaproteobacteria bacterium]|nr:ribosome maturation factor RimP [Gammaproteobacteria bacterium]